VDEATILEITRTPQSSEDAGEDEDIVEIRTSCYHQVFTVDDNPGFCIIRSAYHDAPPVGKWTSLTRVNLIEGRHEVSAEEKKKNRQSWLSNTPGATQNAALLEATTSVWKKECKPEERIGDDHDSWRSGVKALRDSIGQQQLSCGYEEDLCNKRPNKKCSLQMCKKHCQESYRHGKIDGRCREPSHRLD